MMMLLILMMILYYSIIFIVNDDDDDDDNNNDEIDDDDENNNDGDNDCDIDNDDYNEVDDVMRMMMKNNGCLQCISVEFIDRKIKTLLFQTMLINETLTVVSFLVKKCVLRSTIK